MRAPVLSFMMSVSVLTVAIGLLHGQNASASTYFVNGTISDNGILSEDARAATTFVKNTVASRPNDFLSPTANNSDFTLQPRLMKLGGVYILSVEKIRNGQVLYAAETKLGAIEDLDVAAKRSTNLAVAANVPMSPSGDRNQSEAPRVPAYAANSQGPGATPAPGNAVDSGQNRNQLPSSSASNSYQQSPPPLNSAPTQALAQASPVPTPPPPMAQPSAATELAKEFPSRKVGYWTLGLGPAIPRKIVSDHVMYGVTGGRIWDINPQFSIKLVGDADFTSSSDGTEFYNGEAGLNYYFLNHLDSAPYVTVGMGYGYASSKDPGSAEGFSVDVGAGYQFFRTTETTLDFLIHFTAIADGLSRSGVDPSVLAFRIAVNF